VLQDVLPVLLESASALSRGVLQVAERRLATIGELDRERQLQTAAAAERLQTIERLDAAARLGTEASK
jgi:hypothetical protein